MKKILVTGGAGYIGSHCCKALALAGYEPVTYDNLARGHRWAVKWGPLEEGDIQDQDRLAAVITKYNPDAVMHLAAYAYVGESVDHPEMYYKNNVDGSLALLEVLKDMKIDKIVFSSTCAIYGEPEFIPITEDHPKHPINPYGHSKLRVEQLLEHFGEDAGIRSIALRYFNAAGADPAHEIGEDHHPETHLIPLVIQAAMGNRPNITVYGNDYDTPDGTCIRDYIHVTDLAEAHVLALDSLEQEGLSTAYNLGNGRGFSVNEIISKVKEVAGRDFPVVIGDRRPGDPPVLIGSNEFIKKELDWQPKYLALDQIIKTAWDWHSKLVV